jgi:membrane-associated phospholipid phosphatase
VTPFRRRFCGRLTLAALLTVSAIPAMGRTQTTGDRSQVSKTLFTRRDAAVGGAFLLGSVALSHFDVRITRFFQDTVLGHVQRGQRLDDVFTHINETTLTLAGIAGYGIGRLTKSATITDVALHATEAIVGASLASQLIRGPLGRSRPHVTGYSDQYDFEWFKGFREFNYRAFPSIHSGSGFAAATVLVAETHRRRPGATWVVAPIAYGLALTPGLSRMYLGQHWASDVFAGAFMGTFAGLKAVHYNHGHPNNTIDRRLLPRGTSGLQVSPSRNGMMIGWGGQF